MKNAVEWEILIALFRATVEQTENLTGQTRFEAKKIFNQWQRQGYKLLDLIEKSSSEDDLDQITDLIHDSINQIRCYDKD